MSVEYSVDNGHSDLIDYLPGEYVSIKEISDEQWKKIFIDLKDNILDKLLDIIPNSEVEINSFPKEISGNFSIKIFNIEITESIRLFVENHFLTRLSCEITKIDNTVGIISLSGYGLNDEILFYYGINTMKNSNDPSRFICKAYYPLDSITINDLKVIQEIFFYGQNVELIDALRYYGSNVFQKTPNAEKFLNDWNRSFDKEVFKCLAGDNSATPNLFQGIYLLERELESVKSDPILNFVKPNLPKGYDKGEGLTNSLLYLLQNCTVYFVTTSDQGKTVKVKDIFTGEETKEEIEKSNPMGIGSEESNKNENFFDRLGYYNPKHGTIFLFVDKIAKLENPELVFQKVLLHEFIHAALDVNVRYKAKNSIKWESIKNDSPYNAEEEETLDNTLVLYVYDAWGNCGKSYVNDVEGFISSQPKNYSNAIKWYLEFLKGPRDLKNELTEFLCKKILGSLPTK